MGPDRQLSRNRAEPQEGLIRLVSHRNVSSIGENGPVEKRGDPRRREIGGRTDGQVDRESERKSRRTKTRAVNLRVSARGIFVSGENCGGGGTGIQKLLPIAIFVAASVKFVAESAVKWTRDERAGGDGNVPA